MVMTINPADWCELGLQLVGFDKRRQTRHSTNLGRSEESDDAFVKEVEDDEEDEVNEAARDMLLHLPGVNVHNARNIMKECDSIAELAELPRERLRKIAGPVTGQKLFTFFRQKMAAT